MKKQPFVVLFVAALLGLFACGKLPVSSTEEVAVVTSGGVRDGCIVTLHLGVGRQTQGIVHTWSEMDVYQYEVSLKVKSGSTFVDLTSPLSVVVPHKVGPKSKAVFTNLKRGQVYQATVIAKGNVGGTAPSMLLSPVPVTILFDFSASQDVEATLNADIQIPLGPPVPFNGSGTVAIQIPLDAPYERPLVTVTHWAYLVSTLAGSGNTGFADGPGATAQFYYPQGVAVDANGYVYVADYHNNRIRKIQE